MFDFQESYWEKFLTKRLLVYIKSHGIEGKVYQWYKDSAEGRKQLSVMGKASDWLSVMGKASDWLNVTNGAPHGQVLKQVSYFRF